MAVAEKKLSSVPILTYEKICADVAHDKLPAGTKLKSIQELAKRYQVSYLTAQKAVKMMQKNGIVKCRRGDGTYLTGVAPINNGTSSDSAPYGTATIQDPDKVYSIGMVMPYWINVTNEGAMAFHRATKGFLSQLDNQRLRIEMINNEFHEAAKPDFVEKIIQKNLDGIYWVAPQPEHQMNIMRLIDKGIVVVGTGRRFPDIPFTSTFVDMTDMAAKIAEYCANKDKKNIIVLCGVLEGELMDANSAEFVTCFRASLSNHHIDLQDNQIGQTAIFTRDNKVLMELGRNFLERHPEADAIISYHDAFFPLIEELDTKDFWENPESMIVVDVNAEFGFNYTQVGRLPVIRILMPIETLGCAAALEFEKKWLGKANNVLDLTVTLSPPSGE